MKIEIWSDINCPFCYIGKKHLDLALDQLDFKDKIQIIHKAYQLDSSLPIQASDMSNLDYLTHKKGYPAKQVKAMFDQIKQSAKQVSLDIDPGISIPVNTWNAQKLILLAQEHNLANQMQRALFDAYFTKGLNIADKEVLTQLAISVGLSKQQIQQGFDSEKLNQQINQDIQQGNDLQIKGVPFFVIDQKYGISGAQPIQSFVDVLSQGYEEFKQTSRDFNSDGATCSIDGCN